MSLQKNDCMISIHEITKHIPMEMSISGIQRKLFLNLFDKLFHFHDRELYTLNKPNIIIDPNQSNQRLLFYFYYNMVRRLVNSPLGKYLKNVLRDNDIFLDIGANLGMYSIIARDLGAQAYAFEPEPIHVEFLKRNPSIYTRLYNIALSNEKGVAEFFLGPDSNLGSSSLIIGEATEKEKVQNNSMEVPTERLDNIITDKDQLKSIKIIKVDVEGNEENVVKGFENILNYVKPEIWCEVRSEKSGRNPGSYKKVINYLSEFGYEPYIYNGLKIKEFKEKYKSQVFDILLKSS